MPLLFEGYDNFIGLLCNVGFKGCVSPLFVSLSIVVSGGIRLELIWTGGRNSSSQSLRNMYITYASYDSKFPVLAKRVRTTMAAGGK